jgi:hypothetical protein
MKIVIGIIIAIYVIMCIYSGIADAYNAERWRKDPGYCRYGASFREVARWWRSGKRRWFAWYPVWHHFENPPLGLGRLVWLRWIPESREEHLRRRVGFAIAAALLALALMISGAIGAELPCPPRYYFCFEVKAAVATWGEQAMREKARKCGWSEARIEAAAKCLN